MNNARLPAPWRLLSRLCAGLGAAAVTFGAAAIDLNDVPLFSTTEAVPGNLALALSVEWPTATTPAYPSTVAYSAASEFLGYFDPNKCYSYVYNSDKPEASYFKPVSAATNHACSSSSSAQYWSGNYMNWASMQTLDAFRWVLTGGYRSVDTASSTVLTKTYAGYNSGVMPQKSLAGSTAIAGATPFKWDSLATRVRYLGTRMWLTGASDKGTMWGSDTTGATAYNGHNSYVDKHDNAYADSDTTYEVYINVKVCDTSVGVETNCIKYSDTNYKPEGLMQANSQKLRYAVFGYYNDGSTGRNGAVLRARMKYIGPKQPVPNGTPITNSLAEWSSSDGTMFANPDSDDAKAAVDFAAQWKWTVALSKSGAMNYLNQFGNTDKNYKGYDPASELYYAALRYYRNLGNVPSYSSMAGAGSSDNAAYWLDGFPVIPTWTDPIAYSCQRNFVLGIGDVNTWYDGGLPGSSLTGSEGGVAAEVTADTKTKSVTTSTNMVGTLEGYNGKLGEIYQTDGRKDTYYIAGLAYDAHTTDIRSDLDGSQTVNTYWMDVLESQVYMHKNQYWLAAKYGGFDVPDSFQPYASTNGTSTITASQWKTNNDTLTIGTPALNYSTDTSNSVGGTDLRPDNYFPGNRPELMKDGLTKAFAKISSELKSATSTAYSTITPNIVVGVGSYASRYDPQTWTGTVKGSSISFAADGTPTLTDQWDARTLLENQGADNRKIVTCCTSTGAGLAFTSTALSTATLHSRTNYASFAAVPNVSSQSAADFVAYLRGDRTKEVSNKDGKYRTRKYLLGDIVDSKLNPVGPPDMLYYDSSNPGYAAFKRTYKSRKTVVYVGANDGMMHAFDGSLPAKADTTCTNCGTELFAYIPSFVYGSNATAPSTGLASLGNPTSFSHHFMVDAKPLNFDFDFKNTRGSTLTANDWHTVLIGGLGKGGRGYYAIDVTNPSAWTSETAVAAKVLWEFTDSRMGYSYGAPIVVKTKKYGWTAIFTSGYNNADGKGYFFFVNPRTGELLEAVATSSGTVDAPLNMAQATAYVPDYTDFTADAVYAGDMLGNVWRVDLTGTEAYAAPTLVAKLAYDSVAQPVTTRPLIETDVNGKKRYILVGTGRLLADSDIKSSAQQTFYAIADGKADFGTFYKTDDLPTGYTFPIKRSDLVANTDLLKGIGSSPSSPMGWYFDLEIDATSHIAARVNVTPTANAGIVAFAANLPNGEACNPNGTGSIYGVSFVDGTSVLMDDNGVVASSKQNYVITDIAIQRINGSLRLIAGNAGGEVLKVPASFNTSGGAKRLNWRNVTAAE